MKTLANYAVALTAAVILSAPAAYAASAEQCQAIFVKADTNKDGSIGVNEDAKSFEEAMTKTTISRKKNSEPITREEFDEACAKGAFDGLQ
jgi:hypothetical protein